ncbi:MAG: LptF/LptG family permease [Bdellovibrio sp.]|nr:LptF/LptG family permease [Bdellovibrio sp.]
MPTEKNWSLTFSYWRPMRLDWYITTEVLGTFVGSGVFIIFILLMFQALRLMDFFVIHGASGLIILKMAFFMAIAFLPIVLPLAFLISVLVGFSRFSSDSELVAMKACGISMPRIAAGLMVPAILVSALTLKLTLTWVPWGEASFKRAEGRLGSSRAVTAIREGTFTTGFFDLLVFADKVDTAANRLHRVFIFDEREQNNPLVYVAREAEIIPIKTNSELGASAMFDLYEGSMHHSQLETRLYEKMDFETYHLYLKIDDAKDSNGFYRPPSIPQGELLELIRTSSPDEFYGREWRGEYHRRFAVAMTPMIFVLLGIGFGTFRFRSAKAGAIVTGFVIVTIYWVVQLMGTAALQKGTLTAPYAMQLPNLIMLALGAFSFYRSTW